MNRIKVEFEVIGGPLDGALKVMEFEGQQEIKPEDLGTITIGGHEYRVEDLKCDKGQHRAKLVW